MAQLCSLPTSLQTSELQSWIPSQRRSPKLPLLACLRSSAFTSFRLSAAAIPLDLQAVDELHGFCDLPKTPVEELLHGLEVKGECLIRELCIRYVGPLGA